MATLSYKFRSAKEFSTMAIDEQFISVETFKEMIFLSKYGKGTDFDIIVTNAETGEDYCDESTLIPRNSSLLIRRIPGLPRKTIVPQPRELEVETIVHDPQPIQNSYDAAKTSVSICPEDAEWDDFGDDLFVIPERRLQRVQSSSVVQNVDEDEYSRIQALIAPPALDMDWKDSQAQANGKLGPGIGFGRGMGGRTMSNRGFRRCGFEIVTPPPNYVCHRCNVPGHFIKHCPTNGDPEYDKKLVKPPTGIPKSMLIANPDGSYALSSGAVAVVEPVEAAFQIEIGGLLCRRPIADLPPELHCPLCKQAMRYAAFTSKCCLRSFCYECIRDYVISKSICICGATDVLADDILPNTTLRDYINRMLNCNSDSSSAENYGSTIEVQNMESRCPKTKDSSPALSKASEVEQQSPFPHNEEISNAKVKAKVGTVVIGSASVQTSKKRKAERFIDSSDESGRDSVNLKKAASRQSALQSEKKTKKACLSQNDTEWKTSQGLITENCMIPSAGLAA